MVLLGIFSGTAEAENAIGKITLTECDLNTKQPVPGVSLAIYQVAAVDDSENGIAYTADFSGIASAPEKLTERALINGNHQTENTKKLEQYVAEHSNIQPLQTAVTDKNGKITFENLPDGVYFFRQIGQDQASAKTGKKITAYSFFISLPVTAGGAVTRVITDAKPKCLVEDIPQKTDINVYKVWKDHNDKAGKRPERIQVELLDGGVCRDRQMLSDANNWTYHWSDLETTGHSWSVKEVMIPDGYTSTVEQESYDFTITNTFHPSRIHTPRHPSHKTGPVKTGDIGTITFWIGLILASAIGITVLIRRKMKS
ncbi:MAG TPA: hypothetical protein DCF42_05125 [Lachnospiraceae bacterium]|nr:hypothetical protein [Lachnospiraceae bacterium]